MPRSYASIYLTIWSDPDFRQLSADAQWLYFTMLTHPTLTSCGVMDWREKKLAGLSEDMTVERVREAAWLLGRKRMVAVDPDTEEALVRSFVRHDGTLKSPNLSKALVREYGGIVSLKLMELVSVETRRAVDEDPELRGSKIAEPILKQFMNPSVKPSDYVPEEFHVRSGNPSPNPSGNPSPNPSGNPSPNPSGNPLPNPSPNPSISVLPPHPHPHPISNDMVLSCSNGSELVVAHPNDERDRASTNFDLFWSAYPRKVGKQKARTKFTAALKRASAETIIAGAQRLALDPNLPEAQFVPHPTTWLERDGWDDSPLPARGKQSRSQQAWDADMRGFLAEEQNTRFQIGGAL